MLTQLYVLHRTCETHRDTAARMCWRSVMPQLSTN
jgi:hypothetical protein